MNIFTPTIDFEDRIVIYGKFADSEYYFINFLSGVNYTSQYKGKNLCTFATNRQIDRNTYLVTLAADGLSECFSYFNTLKIYSSRRHLYEYELVNVDIIYVY